MEQKNNISFWLITFLIIATYFIFAVAFPREIAQAYCDYIMLPFLLIVGLPVVLFKMIRAFILA
ncbi:MAG: hypothetical protein WCQ99_12610 [Pseudomonadota bacterium]